MLTSEPLLLDYLVVCKTTTDFPHIIKYFNVNRVDGTYDQGYCYGTIHIVLDRDLRRNACGIQVHAVHFWEGEYHSEDIMYSLGRVRYVK